MTVLDHPELGSASSLRYNERRLTLTSLRLIFIAFATLACAASAASGFTGSSLPFNNSLLAGDLNGDRQSDLIRLRLENETATTVTYSVRVKLAGSQAEIASQLVVDRWGVEVIPRDVDGDHDLDLVVASLITHEPLKILLNDGHGRFADAKVSDFVAALWHESGQISQSDDRSPAPVFNEEARTDGAAIAPSGSQRLPHESSPLTSPTSPCATAKPALGGRTRAPPLS